MKNFLLTLLILPLNFLAFGQENDNAKFKYQNGVLLELGGNGLFYSVNYERILVNKNEFKIASQLGFSYYPPSTGIRDFWIPFTITEIWPFGNKHHIELGIGYIFIREALRDFDNDPVNWYWTEILTGRLGYRFQVPNRHLILRAGFTPFLERDDISIEFHPSGGLSIGYSF